MIKCKKRYMKSASKFKPTILFYLYLLSFPHVIIMDCSKSEKSGNVSVSIYVPKNLYDTAVESVKDITSDSDRIIISLCEQEKSECPKGDININVREDSSECDECYSISVKEQDVELKVGGKKSLIYGITEILETIGIRFFNPFYTYIPEKINTSEIQKINGISRSPETEIRGLHLHTLHPIESLFSFWMKSEVSINEAEKIMRWIMRMKGNYVQWVALRDIENPERFSEWLKQTSEILNYAQKIGLHVGINVLTIASSSFQNALVTENSKVFADILTLPFEKLNLSFGEFVGEAPEIFIEKINQVFSQIKSKRPDVEVTATIHVGNFPNLWTNYKGENILFYFLVKYADPEIVPLVHTVMYYNLLDPAGGAYNHNDFALHREFLVEYMKKGKKVGYFPETAYWIAFDNSVPLFLPVYIYSRWKDLDFIKDYGKLYSHLIFSSGWEWGYWLNDYLSLKMSYSIPSTFTLPLHDVFSSIPDGEQISNIIAELAEIQYKYLILKELAGYISGEDLYVYLGCTSKVFFSQPCRIHLEEIPKISREEKEKFRKSVMEPLRELSEEMEKIWNETSKIKKENKITMEIVDSIQITFLRSKFVYHIYKAVLNFSEGVDYESEMKTAEEYLKKAEEAVLQRSKNFFYPRAELLIENVSNPTIYQFGYLKQAHELCFWKRELSFAKGIIENIMRFDDYSCIN